MTVYYSFDVNALRAVNSEGTVVHTWSMSKGARGLNQWQVSDVALRVCTPTLQQPFHFRYIPEGGGIGPHPTLRDPVTGQVRVT